MCAKTLIDKHKENSKQVIKKMKIKKTKKIKKLEIVQKLKSIQAKKTLNELNEIKKIKPSTFELLPFKRLEASRLVTKDDRYLKFLQIETKNINGLAPDEQYEVMHKLEILMRIYEYDFAWLTLNFPPEVTTNLTHWRKKIYEAQSLKNKAREKLAFEQLNKILWAEENLKNLEFYFQIFGTSKQDIKNKEQLVKKLAGLALGAHELDEEKITKILFKLCNLNTSI